jgi:hypothetical protein
MGAYASLMEMEKVVSLLSPRCHSCGIGLLRLKDESIPMTLANL